MKTLFPFIFLALLLCACSKKSGTYTAVKPRYHKTWSPNHTHKKKWHIGRINFRFEKQGVKTVKMK